MMIKCNACGEIRPNELIAWSIKDLNTYCSHASICNAAHPGDNNITQDRTQLMTEAIHFPGISSPTQILLKKLYIEPVTARLDPHQIAYMLKLQSEKGYRSMNETIKEVLNDHILANHGIANVPLSSLKMNWKISAQTANRIINLLKDEQAKIVEADSVLKEDEIKKQLKFKAYQAKMEADRIEKEEREGLRQAEREAAKKINEKIEEKKIENTTTWSV